MFQILTRILENQGGSMEATAFQAKRKVEERTDSNTEIITDLNNPGYLSQLLETLKTN